MSLTEEAPPIEVNFRIFVPRVNVINRLLSLIHPSENIEGEIIFDDLMGDDDAELEKAIKLLLQSPPSDVHLYI
ncbi:MAG: hypothetical protein ACTSWW_10685 [Promethearchaeota archaeon]